MVAARAVLSWMLCLLLASPAPAFKIPIHRAVTAEALERASVKFTQTAIAEILNANECVDSGPVETFTLAHINRACIPNLMSINQQLGAPEDHFDDEQFLAGGARLVALKMQTALMIREKKYAEARKLLGAAAHTLQDFYAHSNWVELGNSDIFAQIEDMRRLYRFQITEKDEEMPGPGEARKPLRLAAPNEDVCEFTLTEDRNGVGFRKVSSGGNLLPKARGYGHVLTSGMFFNVSKQDPMVSKCSHGLPDGMENGINKDDPGSDHGTIYHSVARALALKHTRIWIEDLLTTIRNDPQAIRGIAGTIVVWASIENPTFVDVKAGEEWTFQTPANQRIIWGYEGGIFSSGQPFVSGPEGVNANGLARVGWVPPRMRAHGVGALIGAIYPHKTCHRDGAEAPCPPTHVYIGLETKVIMPATGSLWLLVNDGHLNNNSGYFETSFTLPKP